MQNLHRVLLLPPENDVRPKLLNNDVMVTP